MGIKEKGFADWAASTFPDTVSGLGDRDISHFDTVCIDVNPLLHTCLRNAKSEANFVKLLFADLDRCFRLTIPQATVYLAVDGSPPLAKLKEQIRRRKSKAPSKNKHLDSASITPGTSFMLRVTQYLHYYCARYLATKHHPPHLRFIVDPAESAGEGEAKIMKYLYAKQVPLQKRQVAIFSGDSDVIIQSLLSPVEDIYVLRPGVGNSVAFSVSRLRRSIAQQAGGSSDTPRIARRVIVDFSVLCFLSGNDYMRKLRGGRISKIWPVYKKFRIESLSGGSWTGRYLVTSARSFDFEVFQELLIRIRKLTSRAAFKPDLSLTLSMLGISNTTTIVTSAGFEAQDDSDTDDEEDLGARLSKEELSPQYTRHVPNYLESLLWTLQMYSTGITPDVTFVQVGRYLTIEQLLTFLARDLASSRYISTPTNEQYPSLVTIVCTMTILDASKSLLVPEPWRAAFLHPDIRALTQSMVQDTSLKDEAARIQSLIYQMGQLIVSCIDPGDPLVQVLTFQQPPLSFRQSRTPQRYSVKLPPLGQGPGSLWETISLSIPDLVLDHTLAIEPLMEHSKLAPLGCYDDMRPSPATEWPFKARKPLLKNPVAIAKANGRTNGR